MKRTIAIGAIVTSALGCNALLGLQAGEEVAGAGGGATMAEGSTGGSASLATGGTTTSASTTSGFGAATTTGAGGTCSNGTTCFDPPSGWTLVFGTTNTDAGCPVGTEMFANGGAAIDGDATCSCACEIGCDRPTVDEMSADCMMPLIEESGVPFGTCYTLPAGDGLQTTAIGVSTSCQALPTSNIPAPTFTSPSEACEIDLLDCGAAGACLSSIPMGFTICVAESGITSCPNGWPNQTLVYTTFDDTRSCSGCGCGPPTMGTCTLQLEEFDDASCGVVSGFEPPGACVVNGAGSWEAVVSGAPTCTAVGGTLMGSATPTDPFTVCCQ